MDAFKQLDPLDSPGQADECVLFFPSYAFHNPESNGWKAHVHGWVYRPKENSLKRAALLGLLRRLARIDRETIEAVTIKGRLRPFLYDNKRGRHFSIELFGVVHQLLASKRNGHFHASLELDDADLPQLEEHSTATSQHLSFTLIDEGRQEHARAGSIRLIGERGVSIISDIDDTIKISQVTDRRELFANTFLRDFRAITQMADAYRCWAEGGAAFHYVSASPWQLFAPLAAMLAAEKFPAGSVHLREFRLKDRSLVEFLSDTDIAKRKVCELIMHDFPQREFILVGDSGERDPEMYAGLARDYPQQIQHIHIRNVTDERREDDRMQQAFAGLPDDKWTLFDPDTGPEIPSSTWNCG